MWFLREHGGATIGDLARVMRVSPVTIHRDLERLAREGQVERVQGGARLAGTDTVVSNWALRRRQQAREKRAIAVHAARLVESGSTIFVDSSTTGLAFAEELALRPGLGLTLVTNSPAIASRIDAPSIHVVITPGELNQELRMIGGHWTLEFLQTLKFATAFISGASLDLEQGLGSMTRLLADVLNAARSGSEQTVALVDSSKFGRTSLLQVAPLGDLPLIITDDGLRIAAQEEYKRAGARLLVAPLIGNGTALRSPDAGA
jgi:DeoR family fructose operon transcriptional repressor